MFTLMNKHRLICIGAEDMCDYDDEVAGDVYGEKDTEALGFCPVPSAVQKVIADRCVYFKRKIIIRI